MLLPATHTQLLLLLFGVCTLPLLLLLLLFYIPCALTLSLLL